MKLLDFLKPELVALDLRGRVPEEAIRELVALLRDDPRVPDADRLFDEVLARERSGSTCLDYEMAVPHARSDVVKEMVMAVGRSAAGVDFGDGKSAKVIFLVANPRRMVTEYLHLVGAVARVMRQEPVRRRLMAAADATEFIRILDEAGSE